MSNSAVSGHVMRPAGDVWSRFDALPDDLRQMVREAGMNFDPVQIADYVDALRNQGYTSAGIKAFFADMFERATHAAYAGAGAPSDLN